MKYFNCFLVFYILALISPHLFAQEYSIKQLELLSKKFVETKVNAPSGGKIEIQVSKQDPRTQIPSCSNKLQLSSTGKHKPGKNITVKILCPDKSPWRKYIPVRVKYLSPVFVAATQLEKGETIESENIKLKYIDSMYLRGSHFTKKAALLGAKIKHRVNAGNPITKKQICIICKNELVTLSVRSAGLELKTQGIALSNGTIGEQIRVRNKHSKKIVYARVLNIGQVQINL